MNLLADSLTIYKSWNLQQPPIPPRSHLYSLEPAGVGTPMMESLTSYVIRLAQEHGLRPGAFIGKLIAPEIRPGFVYSEAHSGMRAIWGGNIKKTSVLNGAGKTTIGVLEVLEKLTLRNDLRALTVLPWSEVLASKGLLRLVKAWCPACYQMQHSTSNEVYDSLLWSFSSVKICLVHQTRLLEHCPHCGQVPSLLKPNSLPGHCSMCSQWLGSFGCESLLENEMNWQLWIAQTIGELIAVGTDFHSVSHSRVKDVLNLYINHVTGGNINAFARFLEQPETSFHNWVIGKAKPQIIQLLEMCSSLNTSLTNFLTAPIPELDMDKTTPIDVPPIQRAKKQNRLNRPQAMLALQNALEEFPPPSIEAVVERLNSHRSTLRVWVPDLCRSISKRHKQYKLNQKIARAHASLQAIIDSDEFPPPSLMAVARRLKVTGYPYFWREHCSALCDAISERYSQHKEAESERRKHEIYQEMRQVMLSLHQNGIKPTSGNVSALLTEPAVLVRPHIRAKFKKVRRELGYEK